MKLSIFKFATLALVCLTLGWSGWQLFHGMSKLDRPVDFSHVDYSGSDTCADCHGARLDSWYATYHRTMTQEATGDTVQGRFDGRELDFEGLRVRPVREGGRYFFDYHDLETGTLIQRQQIHRTVGSNRYQQYLTKLPEDETYVRLHYLWHNGDQRWVHMNAAFLGPDGRSYDEHVAIWNHNCIFCHNTGPQPRMSNYETLQEAAALGQAVDISREARFESRVAELGISCETCHGPGAEHVARAADFWQRTGMRLSAGRDTSIINPVRLDSERASHVCAQCHAQRVPLSPEMLRQWMGQGPSYRPGDWLYDHVEPVRRDTWVPIAGQEDLFKPRFWADGTPRLSAYEYQGQAMSACHQKAELSCMDCHTMHAGDPAGQITDRNRGNAPCLRCHQEYRPGKALVEHTRHSSDGSGSLCYNCHMPHLNYGVMTIHRSHHIEVPDPVRDAEAGRPNACLNCHVGESVNWAMAEVSDGWNHYRPKDDPGPPESVVRADGGSSELADAATMLIGDPVQKAIAAWRAGHTDNPQTGRERAWLVPYLLEAMADIYPSTRRFARMSLLAILDDWQDSAEVAALRQPVEQFDFTADQSARQRLLGQAGQVWSGLDKSTWPPAPAAAGLNADLALPKALRDQLVELGRRQDKQISIGE